MEVRGSYIFLVYSKVGGRSHREFFEVGKVKERFGAQKRVLKLGR